MQELIPIREAARRLGVSDTAVRKAAAAGRIKIHDEDKDPGNGRPRCRWPDIEAQWLANSDATKRTHVGPTGLSARRASYSDPGPPMSPAASNTVGTPSAHPDDPGGDLVIHNGMTLSEAKTAQAIIGARHDLLKFEQEQGILVRADEVKIRWSKRIKAAQTRILGIPAACKSRAADLPLAVVAMIDSVCREALEDLANDRD
jgi:hypothetical protein